MHTFNFRVGEVSVCRGGANVKKVYLKLNEIAKIYL